MLRITAESLAEYQAAWIGLVIQIFFDDFTMKNREIDFVKCKLVIICFFVRMIRNSSSIRLDRFNDVNLSSFRFSDLCLPEKGINWTCFPNPICSIAISHNFFHWSLPRPYKEPCPALASSLPHYPKTVFALAVPCEICSFLRCQLKRSAMGKLPSSTS